MCMISEELFHMEKLKITEQADAFNWCFGSLAGRNVVRILTAASCSGAGTYMGSTWPTPLCMGLGALSAGVGNATSTYFFLEPADLGLIERRFSYDLPNLRNRVVFLEAILEQLTGQVEMIVAHPKEPFEWQTKDQVEEISPPSCIGRETMNGISMVIAGGVSTAGSLLAGFVPTPAGIIGGAILTGVGNSLSTILPYKRPLDESIGKAALKTLPALFTEWEGVEGELIELIEKIQRVHSHVVLDLMSLDLKKEEAEEEKEPYCCFATMQRRNISYLGFAGSLSSVGAVLASFYPTPAGIIIGSLIGGGANGASTALVLERIHDRKIKQALKVTLPELALKIERVKQRAREVNSLLDSYELKETSVA